MSRFGCSRRPWELFGNSNGTTDRNGLDALIRLREQCWAHQGEGRESLSSTAFQTGTTEEILSMKRFLPTSNRASTTPTRLERQSETTGGPVHDTNSRWASPHSKTHMAAFPVHRG